MKTYLIQLIDFDFWANTRILQELQSIAPQQNDADVKKANSLFHHILNVQATWLKRIEVCLIQSSHVPESLQPAPGLWEVRDLECEHQYLQRNRDGFMAIIENVPDESVQICYTNSTGALFSNMLTDLLLHLSHHGHYHRGQINLLLRKMGTEPPLIDYIYYIRQLS